MTRGAAATLGRGRHPGGRLGVLIAYLFNGFALTAWTVRLPSIQAEAGMTTAQTGLFLTMSAVGTLVMVFFAGSSVARFGAARTYLAASGLFLLAYTTMAAALFLQSIEVLLVGSVLHGFAFALTNVPQSVLAAGSENAVGRTILPQFHAAYSLGAMLGAGTSALLAATGLRVAVLFTGLIVLVLLVRTTAFLLVRPLNASMREDERRFNRARLEHTGSTPIGRSRLLDVWRDPNTLLIGLVIFAAGISEGTANNWGSVAIVGMFDATAAQGAAVITVFLVAQTIVRLVGGPAVDRFGKRAVLLASAGLAIAGILLFSLSGGLVVATIGAALWGAGSALNVPIGISLAASDRHDGPSKVAAVTSLSSLANIAGPPLIGLAIQAAGVRLPIAAITVVILLAALATSAAVRTSSRRAVVSAPDAESFAELATLDPETHPDLRQDEDAAERDGDTSSPSRS